MSGIYTSSKDPTKTQVKYFDFMVHSKEKVTHAATEATICYVTD